LKRASAVYLNLLGLRIPIRICSLQAILASVSQFCIASSEYVENIANFYHRLYNKSYPAILLKKPKNNLQDLARLSDPDSNPKYI
jgi:hypothetical protein